MLIENGANIQAKDNDSRTPLIWASGEGNTHTAKMLIENGANIQAKDKDGHTPFSWAIVEGKTDTAKMLIDMKANIEAKDKDGTYPSHLCECFGTHRHSNYVDRHEGKSRGKGRRWQNPSPLGKQG